MTTRQRGSNITRVVLPSGQVRWRFRIDVPPAADGKRRQRTLTFRTEGEAVDEQRRLGTAVRQGTYQAPDKITVNEWLDTWLEVNQRSWRASTYTSYVHDVKPARAAFGSVRLQRLTRADVERMVRSMLATGGRGGSGRAPRTVAKTLTILSKAVGDAVHEGVVATNVVARVRKPAQTHQEGRRWSAEQVSTFLASREDDPLVGAWHLSCLGLRRGEVLGLRWGDVDFERGVLHIRQARVQAGADVVVNEPKTARGRRTLPMHDGLVAALRATRQRTMLDAAVVPLRQRGARDGDRLVVVDATGQPIAPDHYSDLFERYRKALDLPPLSLHGLRHTALSILTDGGVPTTVVARIAGHDPSVTMRVYAHPGDDAMQTAVTALGTLYGTR